MQEAIERAIDDCIENHMLEDFLKSRRGEVVKVVQLDYTWERREELIRKEEYEEGLELGTQIGTQIGTQRSILSLLGELGTVPDEIRQSITTVTDEQLLDKLLKLAVRINSFDEYKKCIEEMLVCNEKKSV